MRGPIFVLCVATALPQPFGGPDGIDSRRSVRGPAAEGIAVRAPLHAFAFHHLHLNDPRSSFLLEFYERLFDPATTRRLRWGGAQALQSGPMRLLISHGPLVREAPAALWHFGWGGATLGESYLAHARGEVAWEPPLPPEHLHVHLRSLAPASRAAWYRDTLGAEIELPPSPRRREALPPPEHRMPEALIDVGGLPLLVYRMKRRCSPRLGSAWITSPLRASICRRRWRFKGQGRDRAFGTGDQQRHPQRDDRGPGSDADRAA